MIVDKNTTINEILNAYPEAMRFFNEKKMSLTYTYKASGEKTGITDLLRDIKDARLKLKDLITEQSSLEKIFVDLVKENNEI